ncbi:polyprenyl glycosylphosphotransferase [Arsenicitalea aurantiaca]|uniref:Polyprenyl glycosylphosphotransferase n=2 Tax=Arsenicitalea aurantiaca TaxID=1783274 RepID=A0A433X8I1_9HYPH|nr:polyprenyl glycosylphosphotransferase [Arsenicitalea aurantiaca]
MPVFFRWGFDLEGWLLPLQVNTILASSVAIVLALLAQRQFTALPGVQEHVFLMPTLLMSFLVIFAMMFFLRIEYNRYLFPSSFAIALAWVLFAQTVARRYRPMRFAVVPGGDVSGLASARGVEWHKLTEPRLPRVSLSGIVVDLREDLAPEWERFIANCALAGTRVFHIKQLQESVAGRVEIEHLSENTLGSINPDAVYLSLKQAGDFLLALLVLIITLPVLVLIGLAIRIESPGPALFVQSRVGFRGQTFSMIKFRTMRVAKVPASDPREAAMTRPDDDRITRLGRFLRRTRLDELPQIFNILRGEMSWIGPRPEAIALSQWYEREIPFYRYRHIVRPGISGWAQVNQGHVTAVDQILEKLHFDFYYIKNFSLWLDLLIVLRTLRIIVTGFGAR